MVFSIFCRTFAGMNKKWDDIRVIAFDADDTLWDCQSWFDEVERKCCQLLSPWATAREVSEGLFSTERKNLPLTGYGTKAFTLSLIENAVRVSRQQLSGDIVMRLLELGQELLTFPTTPLPEVKETLEQLSQLRRYQLVVFTKGELLDQENKLQRSDWSSFSRTWRQCPTRPRRSIASCARTLVLPRSRP